MEVQQYDLVITHEEDVDELSLEALAVRAGLHPDLVERYMQLDLIQPVRNDVSPHFDHGALIRLRMICRLRQSLGVNCAGVGIILDLLERISALRRENDSLRFGGF